MKTLHRCTGTERKQNRLLPRCADGEAKFFFAGFDISRMLGPHRPEISNNTSGLSGRHCTGIFSVDDVDTFLHFVAAEKKFQCSAVHLGQKYC
jgi:hypothetical protein